MQDFAKKLVIVVDNNTQSWQLLNTVAHIAAYLGNQINKNFLTQENFQIADNQIPRNSQYPIIVLKGNKNQLAKFIQEIKKESLSNLIFVKEMIETTDDEEIANILKHKTLTELEVLGVGAFGENQLLKQLTKNLSLYK